MEALVRYLIVYHYVLRSRVETESEIDILGFKPGSEMKEGINHPPPSPTPAHPRKKNQSIPSSDSTQKLNKESPENLPQAETLMVYDSVRSPDSFVAGNPFLARSFWGFAIAPQPLWQCMSKGPPAQTDVLMADRQPVTTVTYGIMNHNTHVPANLSCILTRDLSRRLGNQSELHPSSNTEVRIPRTILRIE
ncbi:uncharacterized protein RSE6_11544 [Rhynchosporium secalis]|uniref:Uncharacterized protein n=1 Tax=Rhynchosporium secalis TaxID=38038 RepID=A0A1E1MN72_RHYSE|nr:uncharacterized protein RSE6_11544 [Rhynchosporium secalis]